MNNTVKKPLEIFTMTDQPEECRYCGWRTEITLDMGDMQIHECPNDTCRAVYMLEESDEVMVVCTDCEEEYSESEIKPYKYDPSIKLCDDCHDQRMEEDNAE